MRKLLTALVVAAGLAILAVGTTVVAAPAEAPLDQIQGAIESGVKEILKCQTAKGAFVLGHAAGDDAKLLAQFPMGQTAIALLALEYAKPRLKGDLKDKAIEAIRKGLADISEGKPEAMTYTAGTILTVISMEGADKYKKLIDVYASMLVSSQHRTGPFAGGWDYVLTPPAGVPKKLQVNINNGDRSNTQFAILGLYMANRMGFQVPHSTWEAAREYYLGCQNPDGGWGYMPKMRPGSYPNMVLASTISLNLCDEMIEGNRHTTCKPPAHSKAIEAGMKWIVDNWGGFALGTDSYGLYALERLGILMGRADVAGHDWYNEGANGWLGPREKMLYGTREIAISFAVIFLSRGLEPVVINKLERRGTDDWNNDPYEIKHLVDDLQDHHQVSGQWRIITLDAPVEMMLKTPILYVSGHTKLNFTEDDKKKLKAYVDGGGTILGQACCGRKEFADSFRAFVKETFGGDMTPLPDGHPIYARMKYRGTAPKVKMEYFAGENQQGRPCVLLLPTDYCCKWQTGGEGAHEAFAVGAGIYLYVVNEGRKMFVDAHLGTGGNAPLGTETDHPKNPDDLIKDKPDEPDKGKDKDKKAPPKSGK